ncbi:MAG: 5-formyltetrahydrofolate cyclo-ligase [Nanoarchaeota archaeon]|nr:5-formyltetrahydrofolate cyclo-ligase [Nanoarchaeota archaeon]
MRTILKNKCSLLSAEEVKAHSKTIGETLCSSSFFQKANSILFYYPRKKEVDLRQAIDDALRQKKKVILPTVRDGSLLCRQIFSLEQDLHDGAYGIKEPREDSPLVDASDIDLVLVPGIAFDGEGNRLGHGGGYYDAFFKKTTALKIGIAFGLQIVKAIPKEAHDVPVDSIITERGIIKK